MHWQARREILDPKIPRSGLHLILWGLKVSRPPKRSIKFRLRKRTYEREKNGLIHLGSCVNSYDSSAAAAPFHVLPMHKVSYLINTNTSYLQAAHGA